MFYLGKLVTVFGSVPAISHICFICRFSCAVKIGATDTRSGFPLTGCGILYLLRSRPLVSSMNAKRPLPHSAQFCQNLLLFADHWVSSVTGAFRRMTRASTNIIGT